MQRTLYDGADFSRLRLLEGRIQEKGEKTNIRSEIITPELRSSGQLKK